MTGHEVMLFRSAILWGDPAVAALPRRALRSTLALSILVHAGAGVVLFVMSLLTITPIPAPPIRPLEPLAQASDPPMPIKLLG